MIHTITPNPALDIGGTVKELRPNEKTYVFDETRFPGGNGVNAARIITRLGGSVVATGFLGGGVGDEFEALLSQEGVHNRFVRIIGDSRISVTVTSMRTRRQTRLSFPGPHISTDDQVHLAEIVSKMSPPGLLIIGGSLPPGVHPRFIRRLIRLAKARGVSSIVDMPGNLLRDVIPAQPIFIKPNLTEFQEVVAKKVRTRAAVIRYARGLTRFVPLICVSSVDGGALLVTSSHAWFGRIPKVHVKTTVGAGDSMVGAMTYELWKRNLMTRETAASIDLETGESLLRHGLAAACATLSTHGTRLGTASLIRQCSPHITVDAV